MYMYIVHVCTHVLQCPHQIHLTRVREKTVHVTYLRMYIHVYVNVYLWSVYTCTCVPSVGTHCVHTYMYMHLTGIPDCFLKRTNNPCTLYSDPTSIISWRLSLLSLFSSTNPCLGDRSLHIKQTHVYIVTNGLGLRLWVTV